MRPCDCSSIEDTKKFLNDQGTAYNEWSLLFEPLSVIISNNTTTLHIPQHLFKRFAEWYLEDQEKYDNKKTSEKM